jgi:hypothetical protein
MVIVLKRSDLRLFGNKARRIVDHRFHLVLARKAHDLYRDKLGEQPIRDAIGKL